MDYKDIKTEDSTGSYYNLKWWIKNLIITIISCMPLFIWASFHGHNQAFVHALCVVPIVFLVVFVGDLLRRIARPKAIISEGGAWEMIKKKIYWSIGPQFAAVFLTYIVAFVFFSIFSVKDEIPVIRHAPQQVLEEPANDV